MTTMESKVSYDELCRLCASYNAVKVDIFGPDGKDRQLVDKIHTCLQFKVSFFSLFVHVSCILHVVVVFLVIVTFAFTIFPFIFASVLLSLSTTISAVSFLFSLSHTQSPSPPPPLSLSRIQFRAFTPLNNLPYTCWPITRLALNFVLPKNEMEHREEASEKKRRKKKEKERARR